MSKVGVERPTWLDEAIEKVIDKGDAQAIAQVVANSPQVIEAIKRGLANRPKPGVMGPSYAQNVAKEIREAVAAV
jgi:hypothetical protein